MKASRVHISFQMAISQKTSNSHSMPISKALSHKCASYKLNKNMSKLLVHLIGKPNKNKKFSKY